jgi:hypothetical protein
MYATFLIYLYLLLYLKIKLPPPWYIRFSIASLFYTKSFVIYAREEKSCVRAIRECNTQFCEEREEKGVKVAENRTGSVACLLTWTAFILAGLDLDG